MRPKRCETDGAGATTRPRALMPDPTDVEDPHSSAFWLMFLFALAVTVLSALVHVFAGDYYPKTAGVIPDEYGFLSMAREISQGAELTPSAGAHLSKFLYPALISLGFGLAQTVDGQLAVINVVNSIAVATVAVPAFLLAYRVFEQRHLMLVGAFTIVAAFLPDTFYSIGIMSEPLAIPLAFWWFYFAFMFLDAPSDSRALAYAAVLGFGAFVLYACKEHFIVYVIAFAAVVVLCAVRSTRGGSRDAERAVELDPFFEENNAVGGKRGVYGIAPRREGTVARRACEIAVFAAAFLVPFAASQLALFGSIAGNAYADQLVPRITSGLTPATIAFFAGTLLCHVGMAVGFVPFAMAPWQARFDELTTSKASRRHKRAAADLALFAVIAIVVMCVVVVYTIMIREDDPTAAPRVILRYFTPLLFLVVLTFAAKLADMGPEQLKESFVSGRGPAFVMACAALSAAFLGWYQYDYETTDLLWLTALLSGDFAPIGHEAAGWTMWIARAVAVSALVGFIVLMVKPRFSGNALVVVFSAALACALGVSSVFMVNSMTSAHQIEPAAYAESQKIVRYMESWEGTEAESVPIVVWERTDFYNRGYAYSPAVREAVFQMVMKGEELLLARADLDAVADLLAGYRYGDFLFVTREGSQVTPDNVGFDGAATLVIDGEHADVYRLLKKQVDVGNGRQSSLPGPERTR